MKMCCLVVGLIVTAFAMGCGSSTGDEPTAPATASSDGGSTRPIRDASVADGSTNVGSTDGSPAPEASVQTEDACTPGPAALAAIDLDASSMADSDSSLTCIRCVVANCRREFDDCMLDCECNRMAAEMLRCLQGGGALLTCGGPARASSNPSVRTVVTCVSQQVQCAASCGL
jgi:hypothetical protein